MENGILGGLLGGLLVGAMLQQLSESGFLEGRESFEALREIRFVRNLQASAPHTA